MRDEENTLSVQVNVIEPLGEKMDMYTSTSKHGHVVARVDAVSDLKSGVTVQMHLDMDRVHIFDPAEDGANLTAKALQTV